MLIQFLFSHLDLETSRPPSPELLSVVKNHSFNAFLPFFHFKYFANISLAFISRFILVDAHIIPSYPGIEESKQNAPIYLGQILLWQIININCLEKSFFFLYKIDALK